MNKHRSTRKRDVPPQDFAEAGYFPASNKRARSFRVEVTGHLNAMLTLRTDQPVPSSMLKTGAGEGI